MLSYNKNLKKKTVNYNLISTPNVELLNYLIQQKKYAQAQDIALRIIKIFPNDEETLTKLAFILYELKNFKNALLIINKILELKPKKLSILRNKALIYEKLLNYEKAIEIYNNCLFLEPENVDIFNSIAVLLFKLGNIKQSIITLKKALNINPNSEEVLVNYGTLLNEIGENDSAVNILEKTLKINPNNYLAKKNLAIAFKDKGEFLIAIELFKKIIKINPDDFEANNILGIIYYNMGYEEKAKLHYRQAIQINKNSHLPYWNLYGLSENFNEARENLNKCLFYNKNFIQAKLSLTAIDYYENDKIKYNELTKSEKGHPYVRSFKWIFDLSNKPQMFFNKWSLFRYIFKICDISKPFYEFGVWTGNSFNFIIKNINKGYGFDTFTGLPENWQVGNKIEKAGSYSNSNKIPKIKGGKFIKGEFKKTLPNFFSKPRSVASLINIDVDLYSSTICVLENVRNIVDKDTIIIFDEFLINDTWEQDEAKALFDFCSKYKYKYEVIAYSFFSKQVAIKLIKI